jgi:polysaccharide biosynthesis protein PslG
MPLGTFGRVVLGCLAAVLASLALSATASAAPRSFFGIHPDYQNVPLEPADYERMGAAKVGTVRFQLNWSQIERTKNNYEWARTDALIRNLARRGIEPRPFIFGVPAWAGGRNGLHQPKGKAGNKQWSQFLRDVMRRYGRKGSIWKGPGAPQAKPVRVVQILNEVNSSKFYRPKPNPKRYGQLVKRSKKAIKGVDGKAKVLLAGMFGTPQSKNAIYSWKFLNRLYKVKGIKKSFDGVAVHPYSPNLKGIKQQMKLMRKVMKRNRDGRTKVYVTEMGWGSGPRSGLSVGRKGQAKMLRGSFKLLLKNRRKWKVAGLNWYTLRDPRPSNDPCKWCSTAGLFGFSGKPKPAWDAFRSFTR